MCAGVAQLVEHWFCKPGAVGSSPTSGFTCHSCAAFTVSCSTNEKGADNACVRRRRRRGDRRPLVYQLIERGYHVVPTTRSAEKLERLRALGAEPMLMDGLAASSVGEAVARAEPEAI